MLITLCILCVALVIFACLPPKEHPFIKQLWNNLAPDENLYYKELQKQFDAITKQNQLVEYFILEPQGSVIPCNLTTNLIWKKFHKNADVVAKSSFKEIDITTKLVSCSIQGIIFETTTLTEGDTKVVRNATNINSARQQHIQAIKNLQYDSSNYQTAQ